MDGEYRSCHEVRKAIEGSNIQGSYRSKSVAITEEGIRLAQDLLNKGLGRSIEI